VKLPQNGMTPKSVREYKTIFLYIKCAIVGVVNE